MSDSENELDLNAQPQVAREEMDLLNGRAPDAPTIDSRIKEEIQRRINKLSEIRRAAVAAGAPVSALALTEGDYQTIIEKVNLQFENAQSETPKSSSSKKTDRREARDVKEENYIKMTNLAYETSSFPSDCEIGNMSPYAFGLRHGEKVRAYEDEYRKIVEPIFTRYRQDYPSKAKYLAIQFEMIRECLIECFDDYDEDEHVQSKEFLQRENLLMYRLMSSCLACEMNSNYPEAQNVIRSKMDGNDPLSIPSGVRSKSDKAGAISAYYTKLYAYAKSNYFSTVKKIDRGVTDKKAFNNMQKAATKRRREREDSDEKDDETKGKDFRKNGRPFRR